MKEITKQFTTVLLALAVFNLAAVAQVRDLGIDAFLDQLGPSESQTWLDPTNNNAMRIDAYGRLNTLFGLGLPSQLDGKVTARDLGNGTERVTVQLHARDVLCWGTNFNTSPPTPMFGYSPASIVAGAGPAALGDTTYRIVYAPQPIGQFDVSGEVEIWSGTARCSGALRAGSGYVEGSPGFAQTTQTGLLATGVPGGCPPEKDADCFPAEKVQFKPTGN
jgi:hypothetical protein